MKRFSFIILFLVLSVVFQIGLGVYYLLVGEMASAITVLVTVGVWLAAMYLVFGKLPKHL